MRLFQRWSAPKIGVALTAVAVLGSALAFMAITGADAAGVSGGPAVIVNPANNQPLPAGGSQTAFSFDLPASPADRCAGSSAANGYFVHSYITPASNNPGDLTFNSSTGPNQPAGSFAFPLFSPSGTGYISKNTDEVGAVVDFPTFTFNFNRFSANASPGTAPLPPGDYNVGIACWKQSAPTGQDRFWNIVLTFSADGSDPRGETWGPVVAPTTTTTAAPVTTTTVPPTTTTVPPTTTTIPPETTTTVGAPPPPPPCTPPNGLVSGLVYNLSPASLGALAKSLCNLGL